MLSLIGLGLGNEKDLTLRAIETLKTADIVYLETYTSPYLGDLTTLEATIGKKILPADRTLIEVHSDTLLEKAQTQHVALLIVGDVFAATTHTDLVLRAREKNIPLHIIHNASILTAVGETGLSLYKFGKTASIPYLTGGWQVDSPYDTLKENQQTGLHTLFLLDLRPDDQKFMTIQEALTFLLDIEARRKEKHIAPETLAVGCAALGTDHAEIIAGTIHDLLKKEHLTSFPQCVIIPGKLHFIEEDALKHSMH